MAKLNGFYTAQGQQQHGTGHFESSYRRKHRWTLAILIICCCCCIYMPHHASAVDSRPEKPMTSLNTTFVDYQFFFEQLVKIEDRRLRANNLLRERFEFKYNWLEERLEEQFDSTQHRMREQLDSIQHRVRLLEDQMHSIENKLNCIMKGLALIAAGSCLSRKNRTARRSPGM